MSLLIDFHNQSAVVVSEEMLRPATKTAENMHQKDLELKSLQALEVTFKPLMYCRGENSISKQRFFPFIKTIKTMLWKISSDE